MTTQRRRAWADRRLTGISIANNNNLTPVNLLSNAPTIDTMTVSRIIGHLEINAVITSEIEYEQLLDVGIGVSSAEAFDIGATALPDPQTEGDYPPRGWLYVDTRACWQIVIATVIQRRDAIFDFDLRGMRKIDKGRLFLMVRNTGIGGTGTAVTIKGRVRALCLT